MTKYLTRKVLLGMVSHKMSIITNFGHKYEVIHKPRGELRGRGSKIPKILTTCFMNDPILLFFFVFYGKVERVILIRHCINTLLIGEENRCVLMSKSSEMTTLLKLCMIFKKGPIFSQPLGLFFPPDQILQNSFFIKKLSFGPPNIVIFIYLHFSYSKILCYDAPNLLHST